MGSSAERSISIIMSAYNEAGHIEFAVKAVKKKLTECNFDYEILIFNDASTDGTGKIADKLAVEDSKIRVFHNPRNMNLGYNISQGIASATKTYCGSVPCHGLIASESFDYILPALEKTDVVIAYIANPKVRPLSRRIVSWVNTAILNLLFGFELKYYHFNFYRTDLLKRLPKSTQSYALMVELLVYFLASGASYIEVPFFRIERGAGESKAMRLKNISEILKTYSRLFWRVKILREKINLQSFKESE